VNRFDYLRSLFRGATVSARDQVNRLKRLPSIRQTLQDAIRRQVRLSDKQITAAVGHLSGISAVTVKATPGCLRVDANLTEGRDLVARLIPSGVVCAPRGAKDLTFRVDPASAATDIRLAEVVGAIAAEVAQVVWGPLLFQKSKRQHAAFVESDGDLLRVDLRTVPDVRIAIDQRTTGLMIDTLVIKQMTAEDGALCLVLGIQGMP
jgi:HEXXH motif-containing protein